MSPQALKNSERIAVLEDCEAQHVERIRALEDCVSTLLRLERKARAKREAAVPGKQARKRGPA